MSILCSNCGQENDPQNRFCSTCGEKLRPDTAGRCPRCHALNPANNIYCDDCGARLVPTSPPPEREIDADDSSVRGLSLPSRDPETKDDTAEWLSQLRRDAAPASSPEGDALLARPSATPAAGDVPEWLQEIAEASKKETETGPLGPSSMLSAQPEELPDWLQETIPPAEPTADDAKAEHELEPAEIPPWLAQLAPELHQSRIIRAP